MNTLFWTAAASMTLVLIARITVPRIAPDSGLARFLENTIKFD